MEAKVLSEAKVYVGTYAKYNNGSLFGAWLDLSDYSDKEEFYEACHMSLNFASCSKDKTKTPHFEHTFKNNRG